MILDGVDVILSGGSGRPQHLHKIFLKIEAMDRTLSFTMQLVMLDDVDFIVSGGLSDPEHYGSILRQARSGQAVVLPAFEPADALGLGEGTQVALRAVRGATLCQRSFVVEQAGCSIRGPVELAAVLHCRAPAALHQAGAAPPVGLASHCKLLLLK